MKKQLHAWDWVTLANLHVQIENLDTLIYELSKGINDSARMAEERQDCAAEDDDEAYYIAIDDEDRLRRVEKNLFAAERLIKKLRKVEKLIGAIGTKKRK